MESFGDFFNSPNMTIFVFQDKMKMSKISFAKFCSTIMTTSVYFFITINKLAIDH